MSRKNHQVQGHKRSADLKGRSPRMPGGFPTASAGHSPSSACCAWRSCTSNALQHRHKTNDLILNSGELCPTQHAPSMARHCGCWKRRSLASGQVTSSRADK